MLGELNGLDRIVIQVRLGVRAGRQLVLDDAAEVVFLRIRVRRPVDATLWG
ncbi:hypothetical protein AB0F52_09120 [Amycolatopsis sp. NPDC024027]|uniref:hypothetical protein n=1 Tax=Amycolatopsis sp. NPDC024027 TaxID=3154327 RepID=UPI0033CD5C05